MFIYLEVHKNALTQMISGESKEKSGPSTASLSLWIYPEQDVNLWIYSENSVNLWIYSGNSVNLWMYSENSLNL